MRPEAFFDQDGEYWCTKCWAYRPGSAFSVEFALRGMWSWCGACFAAGHYSYRGSRPRDGLLPMQRLWSQINKAGPTQPHMESPCWVWTGRANQSGYGMIGWGWDSRYVHRLMYLLEVGPIHDGLWVLHRCDNPPCCRPDHLFLGTASDNAVDREAKGRGGWQRRRAK